MDTEFEVMAVADSYRVRAAQRLIERALAEGDSSLPWLRGRDDGWRGHLICLFNPGMDFVNVERFIGNCEIHEDRKDSPTGRAIVRLVYALCD